MGLWTIYVNSNSAKDKLLLQGFKFKDRKIKVHSEDPFTRETIPSEKVIFRDIPLNYDDDMILEFLSTHPTLKLRSNIISKKIMNEHNQETEFRSGERYVYVETDFEPVLPQEVTIGNAQCRIWHYTQPLKCRRCHNMGHRAYDHEKCPAYIEKPNDIQIFWENSDPLSNFYMCKIRIYGQTFRSVEHAYTWSKLRFAKYDEMAKESMYCKTARDVKNYAKNIQAEDLKGWHSQKFNIMEEILYAKANCCPQFKRALLDSGSKVLIEGTMNTCWGIGQSAYYTQTTHPDYLPGDNILGHMLMDIREDIMTVLNGCNPNQPSSPNTSAMEAESQSTPPLLSSDDVTKGPALTSTPIPTQKTSSVHPDTPHPHLPTDSQLLRATDGSDVSTNMTNIIVQNNTSVAVVAPVTPANDLSSCDNTTVMEISTHASPTSTGTVTTPTTTSADSVNTPSPLSTTSTDSMKTSSSLLTNIMREAIEENRKSSSTACSIAEEINVTEDVSSDPQQVCEQPPLGLPPEPAPRVIGTVRRRIGTTIKKITKTTDNVKGPMDSFVTGRCSSGLRRKLSPEKEADTEDDELKRTRQETQETITRL